MTCTNGAWCASRPGAIASSRETKDGGLIAGGRCTTGSALKSARAHKGLNHRDLEERREPDEEEALLEEELLEEEDI